MKLRSCALLCGLCLAACASLPPAREPAPAKIDVPAPPPPAAAASVPVATPAADRALADAFAFHEQTRQMLGPELARQISLLNERLPDPRATVELAMLLGQTRSNGDIARALAVLDPLLRSTAAEAAPWQPLARLLAARYTEQRRLEEQIERQSQQARESQRRIDQLNEKLEALKAIERSLTTTRPSASAASAATPRTPR